MLLCISIWPKLCWDQPPSESPHRKQALASRYQNLGNSQEGWSHFQSPWRSQGVVFGIKEGHYSLGFQAGRTSGLAENSNLRQARQIFPKSWIFSAWLVWQTKFKFPGKSAWLAWDLNFPPNLMSYQSEIQVKSPSGKAQYLSSERTMGAATTSIL